MPDTAHHSEGSGSGAILHVVLELGAEQWQLGFSTGLGRTRIRVISAGDLEAFERKVEPAQRMLGVARDGRVVSC